MKKKLFSAIAVLAVALGFAACSSNDDLTDGGKTPSKGIVTNYVRVSVVGMNSSSASTAKANPLTRADGDDVYDENPNETYHDGTGSEGFVGKVRFYFFNQAGNPYTLANSVPSGRNFLDEDFTNRDQNDPNQATVENRTAATLVLDGVDPNSVPSSVVAVVNTDALNGASLGDASMQLSDLTNLISTADASGTPNGFNATGSAEHSPVFLMSNSVYQNNDGSTVLAQAITDKNLGTTEQEALANPVQIYVERLAAKVTLNAGSTISDNEPTTTSRWGTVNGRPAYLLTPNQGATSNVFPIQVWNESTSSFTTENRNLVAVIDGWGIADGNDKGYLFKQLPSADLISNLDDQATPSPLWNSDDYFRSFWETSATYQRVSPTWNSLESRNFDTPAYTMPNTPTKATAPNDINRRNSITGFTDFDLTKVVIGATLEWKNGSTYEPINLYRFQGRYYQSEEDVVRAIVAISGNIKVGTTAEAASPITAENITFDGATHDGSVSDYAQKIVLTTNTEGAHFYRDGTEIAAATNGKVYLGNSEGKDEGSSVLHYAGGHTYYYTTIQHIWNDNANNVGYFGVVRNHWYRVNINSIVGPGTPVPNPDQPIIPVTPSETLTYLSASINVLQWRIVDNNVNFDGSIDTNKPTTTPATSAKRH